MEPPPPAKRLALSTKYRWCPHCNAEVAERTYRSHRAFYLLQAGSQGEEDTSQDTSLETNGNDVRCSTVILGNVNYFSPCVPRHVLKLNQTMNRNMIMHLYFCHLKMKLRKLLKKKTRLFLIKVTDMPITHVHNNLLCDQQV